MSDGGRRDETMRKRNLAALLFGLLIFSGLLISARPNPQACGAPTPLAASPQTNLGGRMPPLFDQNVARVVADVDRIEADTLSQMARTTLDRQGQVRTLGKLLLFDKRLSVNQNEACSFCHTPETGFTGPIQSLNETTVSYPGSVRTRFSNRKPQSYMYAPFSPVLHYNALQGDFVGGNFWDMRASGRSEEHTSELQSRQYLVCRLLLGKKKHTSELQSRQYFVCRFLLEIIIHGVEILLMYANECIMLCTGGVYRSSHAHRESEVCVCV